MADTWYVKVDSEGVVIRILVDDLEKPEPGDIQLDKAWYYGQKDGIVISDMIRGNLYTVENGRLVPRFNMSNEMEHAKAKKKEEVENHQVSPIIGAKRKADLPKAKKEVEDHLKKCMNVEEVKHTLLIGY